MFKINNRNTRAKCEIRLKLTINIPERGNLTCSGFSPLLTYSTPCSRDSIDNFEQVNAGWDRCN